MIEANQDLIERGSFVDKVCALVDGLAEDKQICVAIDGDWGSGKTFVLKMIEEKLSEHEEYFIIRYDAWENSFYDDPLIAILSCIIDTMQAELSKIEGYKKILKEKGKEAAEEFIKKFPNLERIYSTIKEFVELIKKIKNPFDKDTDQKNISGFKSYQALLAEVKKKLELIVDAKTESGKQGKLVFLVDEIDRCLPNEQLKILERMHHVLNVPNCAVLCAVNAKCIADNVETVYGIDGIEYLKKFFDFTYHLDTNADIYCKRLFNDFGEQLKKIKTRIEWEMGPVEQAYLCLFYGKGKVFQKMDNRSLTRYFDSLQKVCNGFEWERLTTYYIFFIIVGLFIRKNISSLFLNSNEIMQKQAKIDQEKSDDERRMPYYDYLKEYIGVDRKNLPEQLQYRHIQELSWYFNETICYSLGKNFMDNEMRAFYNKPMIFPSDCQKLRNLIIQYGGEKNEKQRD